MTALVGSFIMVRSMYLLLCLPLAISALNPVEYFAEKASLETKTGLVGEKGWSKVGDKDNNPRYSLEVVNEEEEQPATIIYERITRINHIAPTSSPASPNGNGKGDRRRQSTATESSANLFETIAKLKPIFSFIIRHPGRFIYSATPWTFRHLYYLIVYTLYYCYATVRFTFLDVLFPLISILLHPIRVISSPFWVLYSLSSAFAPLWKFFATAIGLGAIAGIAAGYGTELIGQAIAAKTSTYSQQKTKHSFVAKTGGGLDSWKEKVDKVTTSTRWGEGGGRERNELGNGKGKGRETVRIGSEDFGRRKSSFELPRTRPRTSSTISYDGDEDSSINIETGRKVSSSFASARVTESDESKSPRRRIISSRSSLGTSVI